MVDLIHPYVRNAILHDVAVRAGNVEHEAKAVAIEIADAAKHDVSARSRRRSCSDRLPRGSTDFCPPLFVCVGLLSNRSMIYPPIVARPITKVLGAPEPHAHVGRLHRLPHYSDQVIAEGGQIRLVA